MRRRGLFVTGTDTGVGKTVCAAALMHRFRSGVGGVSDTPPTPENGAKMLGGDHVLNATSSGLELGSEGCQTPKYWKPIQTGIEEDDDTAEVAKLGKCSSAEILASGVRLPRPVSPHLAARLAGRSIDLDIVLAPIETDRSHVCWVVEGAGGALVPINKSTLMTDVMARLGFPVLIVSRSTLGTINHTLLTLEALRRRQLTIAGVVLIGPPNRDNREAIEQYGQTQVVGEMPHFATLTPDTLERWALTSLDRDNHVARLFQ